MADEECPHGLDPSWCSLCKATSLPAGVRKIAPRPAPRAPRTSRPHAPAPIARTPIEGFASVRSVLFHASAYEAWPSIAEFGLRTASELSGGDPGLVRRLRESETIVEATTGGKVAIRDQRVLARANIAQHLTDIDLADWLALVSDRVWLYAQQKSLTTLLSRYVSHGGQDVIVFDTRKLLAAARDRMEVVTDELAAPEPWAHCPCRGRDTFVPFTTYRGNPADVWEVAIVGGLDDVSGLVSRVVRYHPDHTTEVVLS